MNNISISLEHVDLLDSLDRLHVELLKCCLELLVVGAGSLVGLLDLASGSTLSSVHDQFRQRPRSSPFFPTNDRRCDVQQASANDPPG